MTAPHFPIEPLLPEVVASLATQPRLVLEAPPGAGKTTRVPLALLAAPWRRGRILMLEPRRIAARAAATYMSELHGSELGATVGYRIRFEHRVSAVTEIEVVTEGILTRLVQDDPTLDGVAAVIFDEFHERNLASDLGLALCLDVQASVRPDLRLVVMSATLDGERLARFLAAPRLTAEGRGHPVTIAHLAARPEEPLETQIRRAVARALAETDGDVLCFLPGRQEITRAARTLADCGAEVAILHGELPVAEQARVLRAATHRRVVLATNVAESSVTLPGVRAVVDSGLAREPRFDPASGMSRLETVMVSQASATQRAGRAGRLAPGRCYRLWPESQRLDPAVRPELHQVELSAFVLELKLWGSETLRFLDPPPPGTVAQAVELLRALDAIDERERITAHGKALLALGVAPRLGNAMLRAPPADRALACDVAALLDTRDPLRGDARRSDDLRRRVQALQAFRRGERTSSDADHGALARIDQAARQWRRRGPVPPHTPDAPPSDTHAIGDVLAFAYPDRIARKDPGNPQRYQLSNGRGALLRPDSELVGQPWLVVAELRFDARDSLILRAAPLDPEILDDYFPDHFHTRRELRFDRDNMAVELLESRWFADLQLAQQKLPVPRDAETATRLLHGIAQCGLQCLPWTESLREWQARLESLRAWCPELELPAADDATLLATIEDWLLPALTGKARVGELDAATLAEALSRRLDYAGRRVLDEHAPPDLLVPSGMRRKLSYTRGEAPVLAVKLQELFGLADTPRIAKGRVPVVLHLLSPRQTPLQVTQDLRSFWSRTYPALRREMQRRYPKHPWPEDPWSAPATHRTKQRAP